MCFHSAPPIRKLLPAFPIHQHCNWSNTIFEWDCTTDPHTTEETGAWQRGRDSIIASKLKTLHICDIDDNTTTLIIEFCSLP
jgi:hypothetical protein